MPDLKTGCSRWVTISVSSSGCWRFPSWICCRRRARCRLSSHHRLRLRDFGKRRKHRCDRAMMHLFLNGLAASAGGGLTYLRNVLPHLSAREGVRVTAAVNPQLRRELAGLPRVSLPEINPAAGALQRFWQEQTSLSAPIRQSGADVLVSVGNFALRKSPVPQILLSRNSLYTSTDFLRDVRRRGEYGLWLDTRIKGSLARRSIAVGGCDGRADRGVRAGVAAMDGPRCGGHPSRLRPRGFFPG